MRRMLPYYLVYLIIVTMLVTGVSFSKYGTIADGFDSARVARPVIRCVQSDADLAEHGQRDKGLVISGVKPGDAMNYEFEIRNFEGMDSINEVLLKYNIVITKEPEGALPSVCTLTRKVSLDTYTPYVAGSWVNLGMGAQVTHTYNLHIIWPLNPGGSVAEYEGKIQTIRIIVNAEQID